LEILTAPIYFLWRGGRENVEEREVRVGELRGILCTPEEPPEACVILCHGLFGSMYSPKYVELAEELGRRGVSSLRFNHREEAQASLTLRGEDLERMVAFVRSLGYRKIGLMGSSLGGCVVLLFSSLAKDLGAVAAWATPCRLEGLRELKRETKEGDLLGSVGRIGAPLLLLHGSEDELVPPWHSMELFGRASSPKVLLVVAGADHRFTGERERRVAVEFTAEWLERRLKSL
jgi:alpha-beta hydrolase superfamily lysophospholipase